MFANLRGLINGTRKPSPPGQTRPTGFFLEHETPAPVPGRWEPARDSAPDTYPQKSPAGTVRPPLVTVQQQTPPSPTVPESCRRPGRTDDDVQALVADGPGDAPEDLSDLTPPADDDRSPESVRARAQAVIARVPEPLRGPTPLADELRRDWQLLNDANGRHVERIRALEAQLREHGIEPIARE
jgi:hypothetical protein